MSGTTYSGAITIGITLSDPGTQQTATITGTVTKLNGDGVLGTTAFPWTVNNKGTIHNLGTTGSGVHLLQGGTVNNLTAAGAAAGGSLIEGYNAGVLINGAAGLVTNSGTIEATGTSGFNGRGIVFTEGGRVVNGSAAVTTALIEGVRQAVLIQNAAGTVTNFGTMTNTSSHAAVVLQAGGQVTNGASLSTAALINAAAGGSAIYVSNGAGVVTNFARITGRTGVELRDGGVVTNGIAGPTAATITGTAGNAVLIVGTTGTVTNFGTLTQTGTSSAIALIDGGRVVNGSATATSALITGPGTGVYFGHTIGTVTNFGVISDTSAARGNAIAFEYGGSVGNFGRITSAETGNSAVYMRGGGSVTNGKNGVIAGVISGVNTGISLRGGAGTVLNSGSIQSSTSQGIYLNGGGTVTNQAGGLIAGGANGIYSRGVAILVTNAGTIKTTGTFSGIYLRGGGAITNQASGRILGGAAGILSGRQGGTVTNVGLVSGTVGILGTTGGSVTVTNSGTISSISGTTGTAIQLGNSVGKDLLVVEAGAVFIGAVNGGGTGEIDFVPAGTANMANVFGFTTVGLSNGFSHSMNLTDPNFAGITGSRITVIGGNSGNTVIATLVSAGTVMFVGGLGADVFRGGSNSDAFEFSAANLTGADTVAGNGGSNDQLVMTTAGTVVATGVTGVEDIRLATGAVANHLTLTTPNFNGVTAAPEHFIRVYGGNSGNTVNTSGVTVASDGVVMYGGAGTDQFTGGAGNDTFVFTAADLGTSDTIVGGTGNDELLMTTAGLIHAGGVKGVESIVLATGAPNTLTLTSANFAVGQTLITVYDGDSKNTVTASALPAADAIAVHAGSGADSLTGSAGADKFYAAGNTTMKGNGGANQFTFNEIGTNTISDFGFSGSNKLVFSNSGFALGFSGATSTPTAWTPAEIAGHFSTGAGTYASASAGFDYTGGKLFYSATGSSGNQHLVATLTNSPAINAATQLFFIS